MIATYGSGVWMSLRAAARLETRTRNLGAVLDLRWVVPLPIDDVLEHGRAVGKLLVVDECRRSGNVSEALAAAVLDADVPCRFMRVNSADSFVPLGDAASLVPRFGGRDLRSCADAGANERLFAVPVVEGPGCPRPRVQARTSRRHRPRHRREQAGIGSAATQVTSARHSATTRLYAHIVLVIDATHVARER